MKTRTTGVILALAAVFALTALTASAASAALPEFKPVPTKKKFTSTSSTVLFTSTTWSVTCSKSATAGEITSASTIGKAVATFTGCVYKAGTCKTPIRSPSGKEGEIVTKPLKGELGTVNTKEAASGVGLLLEPETEHIITRTIANECIGENVWTGNVAGEITPTGKKQTTSKLVFATTVTEPKIATITVKRGKVEPELTAFSTAVGILASNELTFEEALEVT